MTLAGVVARLWNGRGKQLTQSAKAPSELIVEERYEEDGKPYIKVSRGGRFITLGIAPDYVKPQDSIEKCLVGGVPEIAPGKWLPLGQGDYKSVYRPEDGKADYVVKILGRTFKSQKEAETAAEAYRMAYRIITKEIGQHLLRVREVKVGLDFLIYELQDHGNLTSAWILGDGKRERALEASRAVTAQIEQATPSIARKLAAAGIEHLPLHFDRTWDYGRGRPVVYDILDGAGWRQAQPAETKF